MCNENDVTQAFVEVALFATSVDESGLDILRAGDVRVPDHAVGDWSLERLGFTIGDLDSSARATINETVRSFLATAPRAALRFWSENEGDDAIGHDLFLTAAGHGAGFWDRWSGETDGARYGRELTDHAKPYGETYLYVGDDGRIYA